MEKVQQLQQIDYETIFITLLVLIFAIIPLFKYGWQGLEWFFVEKLGIQTKWSRERKQERELLITTAESLNKLQEVHEQDMERSDRHDEEIKEELVNFTTELRQTLKSQNDKMNEFTANRIKDRERSREIQKEWSEAQERISNSVAIISSKLDKMKEDTDKRFIENEEKQNKKEQAKIKAEISNRYSIYHERKWITDIEFEALEGLISTYESFGGLNSFVHSVVQKEMFTWKKINEKEKPNE